MRLKNEFSCRPPKNRKTDTETSNKTPHKNMTREDAKQLLPIIQQFADGKVVQFNKGDASKADWGDINYPEFCETPSSYRIKPEPITKEVWVSPSHSLVTDSDMSAVEGWSKGTATIELH